MIDWLIEPFLLGFQQRALIGGLIAAVMSATVGVWLVLRGMSFFGDAFVHGVLPGIAAAVVFDFSPILGAAVAAAVMVGAVEVIHRHTNLKEDTAIGLLFVGMMALGVVIISRSSSFTGSLTSILFGDALGVSWAAIQQQAVLAVVVIVGSLLLYRPLLVLSFSPVKAESLGMRPKLTHALLLVLIATAVIGSFQAVGTMLVFSLLVAPPSAAALLSRSIPMMIALSAVIGAASVVIGLILSYYWGTAAAATMALVPIVFFLLVMEVQYLRRRRTKRPAVTAGVAA
ncbi:Manganese transport system membrane protein MntB [Corynebacterium atrinae]|uniref:metal ABC transporter permease n=1 Tax=Corynebacterium atrinae TaxID=1336740 RepID=UPI0025B44416|nr:metal ABC transporter permease [Corynebacterium atrinae]WJY63870.1 Manganese transport system membrane protein MntB [Corynebacterium atrinae]